ncbi:RNA polymerase sigma factor [Lunatibacter salilacus]|uniref:RNA polymerase sigma factor n=1 Tax=Lunatibacter salilacus TaxID=2483804 RepID=UPI00131AECA2|nr:sigma-70 family RNA polymerase sigma factor [Lunatibacter salilacus]
MKIDPNHVNGPNPLFSPGEFPNANQENSKLADRDLWEHFKQGDESAFICIYKAYANPLFHFGCQFCGDREAVKDCLQDFFIYLRKNRAGFGATDSIRFYLLKSFKRRMLETIKTQSKTTEKKLRFTMEQFPVELSSEAKFIQQQMEVDLLADLNRALESLDNREREAIYYFYYQGLSYEQIADIFDFSYISSARRLIYKALANLRKTMLISGITYFTVNQLH